MLISFSRPRDAHGIVFRPCTIRRRIPAGHPLSVLTVQYAKLDSKVEQPPCKGDGGGTHLLNVHRETRVLDSTSQERNGKRQLLTTASILSRADVQEMPTTFSHQIV